jgi:hypothetical protein
MIQQEIILNKSMAEKLAPDPNKMCPHCGTRMIVCAIPGSQPEEGSWMYNCLWVDCPYHDSDAEM